MAIYAIYLKFSSNFFYFYFFLQYYKFMGDGFLSGYVNHWG